MDKFLNKGISTPIAIGIILVLAVLVGGFILWQRPDIEDESFTEQELETVEEVEPYIEVLSPNGGEEWLVGNDYTIKWQSGGIEKVSIWFYMPTPPPGGWPPGASKLIAKDYSADREEYVFNFTKDYYDFAENWRKLYGLENPAFKVLIFKSDSYSEYDISDNNFSVVGDETGKEESVEEEDLIDENDGYKVPEEKFLNIISPTKDEKWKIGEPHTIQWESNLIPDSHSDYIALQKYIVGGFSGGVGYSQTGYITAGISSNNPVIWNVDKVWPNLYVIGEEYAVGEEVKPGTYRIRIFLSDIEGNMKEDYSELFQITE